VVALGLIATAAGVSTVFCAFALTLLPTLALVGLVTFNRVLQSGIHALVMSQADPYWARVVRRFFVAFSVLRSRGQSRSGPAPRVPR
jgi:hypothetical protein